MGAHGLLGGEEMTLDEAKAQAQQEAVARGWSWREPVSARFTRSWIFFGRKLIEVRSNADMRGTNVSVVFDAESGAIERTSFLPR